jgi:cytoplasmic iron level regulating protein YaaA (DUF328/UPF0246 family)
MLAILSPAKSLDESPLPGGLASLSSTTPSFEKDVAALSSVVKRLKPADLKQLMGISDALAELNHERFQELEVPIPSGALPAATLFDGDVYKGFDARSLEPAALEWAQDHVAILSGLYGLLRPLDRTHPYRLEMGTKLSTDRGDSLYDFWGTRIAERIDAQLQGHADPVVVDLASKEYSKAVPKKGMKAEWLTIQFKEIRDGKPRVISFFAKKARGLMARFLVENRIEQRDGLKAFDAEGYAFDPDLSKPRTWVFTRAS